MTKYSMKGFILITLLGVLSITGCSDSGFEKADAFMKLKVEGNKYVLKHMTFEIRNLNKKNMFYISLGQDVMKTEMSTIPSGGVFFDVFMDDKKELLGEIDFSEQRDQNLRANGEFTLTKDLSIIPFYVANVPTSTIINITSIEGGYVEGFFEGLDWIIISQTEDLNRRVDVTGTFRAKLSE